MENKDIDNKMKNNGMEKGYVKNEKNEKQSYEGNIYIVLIDKRMCYEMII